MTTEDIPNILAIVLALVSIVMVFTSRKSK